VGIYITSVIDIEQRLNAAAMEARMSILFYGKSAKRTTDNLVPIYLRVTINGQRFEMSTQRYVEQMKWSSQAGRMKGNSEEAKRINIYLDTLRAKVYHYEREILQSGLPLTIESFKEKWIGVGEKARMLCKIFEDHNEHVRQLIGKDFSAATLERYKTSLDHTKSFMKWKYGTDDIDIMKLNFEFVSEYEFWLKSVRNCNHNTTMKYIGNFRKIVNICIKNGWLQKDPFIGYKMTKKEVVRTYLLGKKCRLWQLRHFLRNGWNRLGIFSCSVVLPVWHMPT